MTSLASFARLSTTPCCSTRQRGFTRPARYAKRTLSGWGLFGGLKGEGKLTRSRRGSSLPLLFSLATAYPPGSLIHPPRTTTPSSQRTLRANTKRPHGGG